MDFLWQNIFSSLAWLVIVVFSTWAYKRYHKSRRHVRVRHFFGANALEGEGILVTIPVFRPLTTNVFDSEAEKTEGIKVDESGKESRRPIYGNVFHFDDFQAANEIFDLLREEGVEKFSLIHDSDALSKWDVRSCLICLGSPFVNATTGELLKFSQERGLTHVAACRPSFTLDSYRLHVAGPERLVLGVDQDHAIGVIWRLPNPSKPDDSIVAVWGDRAESTFAAARFFHTHFQALDAIADGGKPLIIVLAILGHVQNFAEIMYVATDRVIERKEELLKFYRREEAQNLSSIPHA